MTCQFELHEMDCRMAMSLLMEPDSVDAIVTDPPYGLGKEPDAAEVLRHWLAGDDYAARGGGFMNASWDAFVPGPSVWREAYRVLKPGGYLIAFFGTRTYDLGTLAIRLAGFEIRDQLAWVFGSGFPKSLDVSKAIDKAAGAERVVTGSYDRRGQHDNANRNSDGDTGDSQCAGRPNIVDVTAPATEAAKQWQGWGTALKPAYEPIVLARKPLSERTVAANVLTHGTGAINVDGCRVAAPGETISNHGETGGSVPTSFALGARVAMQTEGQALGRWPANLCHDGSDEVLAEFPASAGQLADQSTSNTPRNGQHIYGLMKRSNEPSADSENDGVVGFKMRPGARRGDSGSAARFFYCSKASKADRNSGGVTSTHPTVKPTDLMRWLCRLVTPPGGTVLDPFTGSGSTGKAALLEGLSFIGCEMTPEYADIARARLTQAQAVALALST